MKGEGEGKTNEGHFDRAAATWEDNPVRAALTAAILRSLRRVAPLRAGERVLEYGCGTAALGRGMAAEVREVVGLDASEGMAKEARRRAEAEGLPNLTILQGDLLASPPPSLGAFDRVVCAMVLHHVADIPALLPRLFSLLRPGGLLAVADLEAEDGSFHADRQVPHAGFDAAELGARLGDAGFAVIETVRAHEVNRGDRTYPVFMLTARRPRIRLLFLCTGNSCRSQMVEGWARHLRGDVIEAYSAGIEMHGLNPMAVKAMAEAGVDISGHRSKTVDAVEAIPFDAVVTVCGHANETCPMWLMGRAKVVHVGFDDPPALAKGAGTEDEALVHYRRVRDEIRAFVETLPGSLGL